MVPKVDGLLRKSLKLQPILKCALSRVVKHLVDALLELRVLELVEDAADLPVEEIFRYIDFSGDLLLEFLILSRALSLRLKFLVELVEFVLESTECLLELRSQHVESLAVPLALRGLLGNVFARLIDAGLEELELLGVRGRQLVIRLGLGARHSRVGGCIARFRNLLRELFPDRAEGLLGRDLRLALPVGFLGQRVLALADAHSGWLREALEFERSLQRIQLRGELAHARQNVRQLRELVCVACDLFEGSDESIHLVTFFLDQRLQSGGKDWECELLTLDSEDRPQFFLVGHRVLWQYREVTI